MLRGFFTKLTTVPLPLLFSTLIFSIFDIPALSFRRYGPARSIPGQAQYSNSKALFKHQLRY